MKLSYAKAATLALAGSALLQASICSRSVDIQEPKIPPIERPAQERSPEPLQERQIRRPAPSPPPRREERPDGGSPQRRRESPGPFEPLREELQSRVASR